MSSQGRSASSGVRNLRAMFENKDDSTTSPPPNRGRSPAPSTSIGSNNSTSPRPLSKVRTSFVAVERNGQSGIQWGLRKETTTAVPEDSTMAHRRESFSENETTDPSIISERKKSIQDEFQARKNSVDISETIPEFALEMPSEAVSKQATPKINPRDAKPAARKPTGNPDKTSSVEERNTKLLPADPTSSAAVSGGKALKGSSGLGEDLKGLATGKVKATSSAKPSDKATPSKSSKPAPISTAKTATLSTRATKSPALPKTPVTPGNPVKTTSRTTATSTTAAAKAAKPATEKSTRPATTATTTKPSGPSTATSSKTNPAVKKPAPVPSSTGFVKPRPKSPTKPVKLPSSLTAPTSSSLSKLADGGDPRRTSGGAATTSASAGATTSIARSTSRTSTSQKTDALRKTTNHSRPSLGPPPSASLRKQPSRQSLSKSTAPADEGFLARMMRPTTASASKTHDKAVTPPKPKLQSRPGTRNGQYAKLESQGSPVAARPPMPTAPPVPTLKPLSAKATTAGKSTKKAEALAKKESPAEAVSVKDTKQATMQPVVAQKSDEPVAEAASIPAPVVPVLEPLSEPAPAPVVEEAVVEEKAAPVAIAIPTQPEIDEPAPPAAIEEEEEAAPAAPVEEAEPVAVAAAVVDETIPEETTAPAAQTVDHPVVTDKVDVPAIMEQTEKEDQAEGKENEGEGKEDEAEETQSTTETEPEAAEPAPESTDVPADADPATEPATELTAETPASEPADATADATTTASAPEETAEIEEVLEAQTETEDESHTEETTESKSEKVTEADNDDDAEDVAGDTTPIPAATPVLAL